MEEIQKMKKNKIQFMQVIKSEEGKNDTFFSTVAYDTSGRRLFIKTADMVIANLYDKNGRIIHRRDSVFRGMSSKVSELNCSYDTITGKLKAYKTENNISDFLYKRQTRELFEQMVTASGPVMRKYYKYDDKERLAYRLFADPKGKPIEEEKIQYTNFNQLDNVKLTLYKPFYAKSITATTYSYNADKKLASKFINVVDNYGDEEAISKGYNYNPTNTSSFFNYEYDAKGNLVKESHKSTSSERLNYVIERTYDANNLMTSEKYFNYLNQNTYTLNYKYAKRGEITLPTADKKTKSKK